MSSTTTTTTTTTSRAVDASTLSILSDYEIHHTGSETQPQPRVPRDAVPVSQPVDWPSHYRRIPSYRPVNRNLSYEERSAGTSPVEYMFIQTMLHGVWLNAVSIYAKSSNWIILIYVQSVARLWRFTGGRINDKIFHYEVGGEW